MQLRPVRYIGCVRVPVVIAGEMHDVPHAVWEAIPDDAVAQGEPPRVRVVAIPMGETFPHTSDHHAAVGLTSFST